ELAQLILGACPDCPSSVLRERDVGKAVDAEAGRNRRRRNLTAAQLRIARLLPAAKQAIVFDGETQPAVRGNLGLRGHAEREIEIVVRTVSAEAGGAVRQVTEPQAGLR